MGVNDLVGGAIERECARRRVVGGDGKARFNEPDGERGRAFVPAVGSVTSSSRAGRA